MRKILLVVAMACVLCVPSVPAEAGHGRGYARASRPAGRPPAPGYYGGYRNVYRYPAPYYGYSRGLYGGPGYYRYRAYRPFGPEYGPIWSGQFGYGVYGRNFSLYFGF